MKIEIGGLSVVALAIVVGACAQALAGNLWADEATGTGSIQGQVVYGRDPAANINISLDGPAKKTAKSDGKGQFAFTDLPPGEYTLEAQGTAKNNIRKAKDKVTVPDPPKEPVAITIKLN